MSIWPHLLGFGAAATAWAAIILWETRDERAKCRSPEMLKGN